jgi:hypothetical protein
VSYLEHSALLAQGLGRLISMKPGSLDSAGLQAALSGRTAVLDLLVSVHREVAGVSPDVVQLTFEDLGRHPVAVLGRALREHPRIRADLSPIDVHALGQPSRPGATWLDVGRHALLAQHHWEGGGRPLTGDAAWSVLADVAALARAVADLDAALAFDSDRLHRPDVVTRITPAARCTLRVAASETLAIARFGPLPEVVTDRLARYPLKVIPVNRPADLAHGQCRLVELLQRVTAMRPEHVEQVAIANARTCLAVARLATSVSDQDDLATAMRSHAALLGSATNRMGRVTGLDPGDPRPLQQAGELARMLRAVDHGSALDVAVVARNALAVTRSLAVVTEHATNTGRWLVPDPSGSAIWTRWRIGLREPTITTTLRAAAADAQRANALPALSRTASSSRQAFTRPHSALSAADALHAGRPRRISPVALTIPPGAAPASRGERLAAQPRSPVPPSRPR